jgi:hypothetical protein
MHQNAALFVANNEWDESLLQQVMEIYQKGPFEYFSLDLSFSNNIKVPNSLKFHTIENFYVEITKALKEKDVAQPSKESALQLLSPIIELLRKSTNKTVLDYIMREILDRFAEEKSEHEKNILEQKLDLVDVAPLLYTLPFQDTTIPQNRNRISKYLKAWGEKVGIPFADKVIVTGMQVEEVPVTMSADEVREQARKRKRSTPKVEVATSTTTCDSIMKEGDEVSNSEASPGSPRKKSKAILDDLPAVDSNVVENQHLDVEKTEVVAQPELEAKSIPSKAARKNRKRREKVKVTKS